GLTQADPSRVALRPSRASDAPSLHPLSLHDALPICLNREGIGQLNSSQTRALLKAVQGTAPVVFKNAQSRWNLSTSGASAVLLKDRKSTRLNSSHVKSSYAVFCLKKNSLLQ